MKSKNITGLLIFIFFVGLSVLLYPPLSNLWNSRVQSRAIASYEVALETMDTSEYDRQFAAADEYNRQLARLEEPFLEHEQIEGYNTLLNVAGNGVIGYVNIEKLNIVLPIYHGTSESVLNVGAGHLEGSSLPVGGVSTHSIISAHRGLPTAQLFSRLDELREGDIFTVKVLNRLMTYEVNQIRIVKPDEVEELALQHGQDYCTLVTCTPYGVNSHRLLVRGERTENIRPVIVIKNEAYEKNSLILAPFVAAPILLFLLVGMMVKYRKNERESGSA